MMAEETEGKRKWWWVPCCCLGQPSVDATNLGDEYTKQDTVQRDIVPVPPEERKAKKSLFQKLGLKRFSKNAKSKTSEEILKDLDLEYAQNRGGKARSIHNVEPGADIEHGIDIPSAAPNKKKKAKRNSLLKKLGLRKRCKNGKKAKNILLKDIGFSKKEENAKRKVSLKKLRLRRSLPSGKKAKITLLKKLRIKRNSKKEDYRKVKKGSFLKQLLLRRSSKDGKKGKRNSLLKKLRLRKGSQDKNKANQKRFFKKLGLRSISKTERKAKKSLFKRLRLKRHSNEQKKAKNSFMRAFRLKRHSKVVKRETPPERSSEVGDEDHGSDSVECSHLFAHQSEKAGTVEPVISADSLFVAEAGKKKSKNSLLKRLGLKRRYKDKKKAKKPFVIRKGERTHSLEKRKARKLYLFRKQGRKRSCKNEKKVKSKSLLEKLGMRMTSKKEKKEKKNAVLKNLGLKNISSNRRKAKMTSFLGKVGIRRGCKHEIKAKNGSLLKNLRMHSKNLKGETPPSENSGIGCMHQETDSVGDPHAFSHAASRAGSIENAEPAACVKFGINSEVLAGEGKKKAKNSLLKRLEFRRSCGNEKYEGLPRRMPGLEHKDLSSETKDGARVFSCRSESAASIERMDPAESQQFSMDTVTESAVHVKKGKKYVKGLGLKGKNNSRKSKKEALVTWTAGVALKDTGSESQGGLHVLPKGSEHPDAVQNAESATNTSLGMGTLNLSPAGKKKAKNSLLRKIGIKWKSQNEKKEAPPGRMSEVVCDQLAIYSEGVSDICSSVYDSVSSCDQVQPTIGVEFARDNFVVQEKKPKKNSLAKKLKFRRISRKYNTELPSQRMEEPEWRGLGTETEDGPHAMSIRAERAGYKANMEAAIDLKLEKETYFSLKETNFSSNALSLQQQRESCVPHVMGKSDLNRLWIMSKIQKFPFEQRECRIFFSMDLFGGIITATLLGLEKTLLRHCGSVAFASEALTQWHTSVEVVKERRIVLDIRKTLGSSVLTTGFLKNLHLLPLQLPCRPED